MLYLSTGARVPLWRVVAWAEERLITASTDNGWSAALRIKPRDRLSPAKPSMQGGMRRPTVLHMPRQLATKDAAIHRSLRLVGRRIASDFSGGRLHDA